jgi:hypothetical protein
MKNLTFIFVLFTIILSGCKQKEPSIEGLWIVESVKMGDKTMTPNARWMRFHKDFTQVSGNGWFQHSFGTYKLDQETKELSVTNTNGTNDKSGPFVINISRDTMTWKRLENNMNVVVQLKRAHKLPTTYGDQLLGLWKLDNLEGKGSFFNSSNGFLFLRWDKRFEIASDIGRFSGVYNAHGHKSEVEFIPYGDNLKRSFWKVAFKENQIDLTLLNSDSTVTRSFTRIHDFPN